jgi:hypothetical protein
VEGAISSEDALVKASLNWKVIQQPIVTCDGIAIEGYKANIRDSDNKVLGVVTDRYKLVQIFEAFGETLFHAEDYMDKLGNEIYQLNKMEVTDELLNDMIKELIPIPSDATELQEKNVHRLREDVIMRFYYAPDLQSLSKSGYRFINAVSDFATHAKPLRETNSYRENLFARTIEGNSLIDKSYQLVKQTA